MLGIILFMMSLDWKRPSTNGNIDAYMQMCNLFYKEHTIKNHIPVTVFTLPNEDLILWYGGSNTFYMYQDPGMAEAAAKAGIPVNGRRMDNKEVLKIIEIYAV